MLQKLREKLIWIDDVAAERFQNATLMASWRRGPVSALLAHSDRGSQYTSEQFFRLLKEHGVFCSMSRGGDCWDNAAMESFFLTLRTERTSRRNYQSRDEARADAVSYFFLLLLLFCCVLFSVVVVS